MPAQCWATRPGALRGAIVAAVAIFPLVVAFAAGPGLAGPTAPGEPLVNGAKAAVLRGRVIDQAGAPLADVRVRVAVPATDMRFVDYPEPTKGPEVPYKLVETRTDAGGFYRVEIAGITGPTKVSLDAMKPGYSRRVGALNRFTVPRDVEVRPGAETEAQMGLKPAPYFRGTVVDERGKPISGVKILGGAQYKHGCAQIERTVSNPDGSFELFCFPDKLRNVAGGGGQGTVGFIHPDYISDGLDDIYTLAPADRTSIKVVLRSGYKVTGTVIGRTGKPVPRALVSVGARIPGSRRATLTDANGKFALRGLGEDIVWLRARSLEIKQKAEVPLAPGGDRTDLKVRLEPIVVPGGVKSYSVLGMRLADVTPELKAAYDLPDDKGAMVLDPGPDSERLKIRDLAEGDMFSKVGTHGVSGVREFVDRLLTEPTRQFEGERRVPVIIGVERVDIRGTRGPFVRLTEDDRKQLQELSAQLAADSP